VETWRWRRSKQRGIRPSPAVTWALRAFFLVVIVNGAIIFAVHAASRVAGSVLVSTLLWCWIAGSTRKPGGSAPVVVGPG
jgi:hypothetical protein